MKSLVMCMLLVGSSVASAQARPPSAPTMLASSAVEQVNVQNPTTIEFAPSSDHSVTENGVALVTRYDAQIVNATNAVVATINLGKLTPVGGLITNTTLLKPATVGLLAGTYTVKVVAVGPGGSTSSGASNPFDLTPRSPTASGTPVVR